MSVTLNPSNPIMVVDDEEAILLAIDTALRMAGINNIIICNDSRKVMDIISKKQIEILLLDLVMPHIQGEKLLDTVISDFPEIPIIIVTGTSDMETAVRCVRSGAFDYLLKPVEEGRLITAINNAISFQVLKRENRELKERILSCTLEHPDAFSEIVTNNMKMLSIFRYIEAMSHTSQPVLITGETGVGKELIAEAIHRLSSLRGPFTAVNMAGLDDHIFSDTLFGHVKGAFTGADKHRPGLLEKSSDGTLFMDEIGELSPPSQVKLLRLLQDGDYFPLGQDGSRHANARIVTATNLDLRSLQESGQFRKDLFYRLRTHHIHIPPLRERMDDIPLLVDYFLDKASDAIHKQKPTPPKELITLLGTYDFPGNVRELQSMIFDAVSSHSSKVLSLDVFKSYMGQEDRWRASGESEPDENALFSFSEKLPTLRQAGEQLVKEALIRSKGNQTVAARLLGISQQALSKRLSHSPG